LQFTIRKNNIAISEAAIVIIAFAVGRYFHRHFQ